MKGKLAMPGDRIAACEEYIAGAGTHEVDGSVYASIAGEVRFSDADKTVSLVRPGGTCRLKQGDAVLGEVGNVTNSLANVHIYGLEGTARPTGAGETGAVHVSKISESFTDDARKEYHTGDLVRAFVLQISPSIQLTTKAPELGVLKGWCTRCRSALLAKSGKLYCATCDRYEHRKLASDFTRYTPEWRE